MKLIDAFCDSNIKSVIEEHVSSEIVGTFSGSMIMMKLLWFYHQALIKKTVSRNIGKPKAIQEVVSSEVSKLNHIVINEKERDKTQFPFYILFTVFQKTFILFPGCFTERNLPLTLPVRSM